MSHALIMSHFLVLGFAMLISSFLPVCLSSYPFPPRFDYRSYLTRYPTSDDSNVVSKGGYDRGRSYYNYDEVILDRARRWRRPRSRALPPLSSSHPRIINVERYVRRGSRRRDHTKAFKKAWKVACSTKGARILLVPKHKKYRVRQIKFSGPCYSNFVIKIKGKIEASTRLSDYRDRQHWLSFENLNNFRVDGGGRGTIDGRGQIWWQNSCKINASKPCQHAPTAVTFVGCKNFVVDGLKITNAQQMHLTFQKCAVVRASNIFILSPEHSPNTDGIHVTETRNIQITRSLIRTGDDCISIVSGSKQVQVSDITCGPGHGISIGSLGKGNSKARVSNVLVNKARLSGTLNGVRIKTWQGGQGYAKDIVFQNIAMHNVSNPIIIDQNYCDQKTPCTEMKSAVHVSNVLYKNIKGTSHTDTAIKFDCSKHHHCRGIVLQNVNLVKKGKKTVEADCNNVILTHKGEVSPKCFKHT